MKRRGQAALEFLMTYGWAILVVLVVIGALAYFGVLNPDTLVPEKCTLPTGISCKDFTVATDEVKLSLENGMGRGIKITLINISQVGGEGACEENVTNTCPGSDGCVNNGAATQITIGCAGSVQDLGRKVKLTASIDYYFQDSTVDFTHTAEGEILAKLS